MPQMANVQILYFFKNLNYFPKISEEMQQLERVIL